MTGTKKLLALKAKCHTVVPVFGGRHDSNGKVVPVRYAPRTKYDPMPWFDGFFYWRSSELTAEPQHTPDVTDAQWVEQRHLVEDTTEFIHNNLGGAGKGGVAV